MSSGYAEAGMKILQRPIKQMDIIVKFEDKMQLLVGQLWMIWIDEQFQILRKKESAPKGDGNIGRMIWLSQNANVHGS